MLDAPYRGVRYRTTILESKIVRTPLDSLGCSCVERGTVVPVEEIPWLHSDGSNELHSVVSRSGCLRDELHHLREVGPLCALCLIRKANAKDRIPDGLLRVRP